MAQLVPRGGGVSEWIRRTGALPQVGMLSGRVTGKVDKKPIAAIVVVVKMDGVAQEVTLTDVKGLYSVYPLVTGNYTVEFDCNGDYKYECKVEDVSINIDKMRCLDVELIATGYHGEPVTVSMPYRTAADFFSTRNIARAPFISHPTKR